MTNPTKAKPNIIKLEPGTDLVGTVKFVSFYPEKEKDGEKYGAQWGLTGTFDGAESRVFIDTHKLVSDISDFLKEDGKWPDGNLKYKWTEKKPIRLHPYVKDKKHYVAVTVDGEKDGSPPIQQAPGAPLEAIKPTAEEGEHWLKAIRKDWADLQDTYECCVKIALKAWEGQYEDSEGKMTALVAAAATVFIEANKRNLPPPPKREPNAAE